MKQRIVVGSRDSALAMAQARLVMEAVAAAHPELEWKILGMKTTGDLVLDRRLDQIGGKGLFVRELDHALREKKVDITIHSLKDLPLQTPADLPLLAFFSRGDARDALILPQASSRLDASKPIGCGSARRELQLRRLYPQMKTKLIRGNILTRLQKLETGEYSALVLSLAGLQRLGLQGRASRVFEPWEMLPAAGQAILAVQGRAGEDYSFLKEADNASARFCAMAERAFVRVLDGGCSSPIAAYAQIQRGMLHLTGLYYEPGSNRERLGTIEGGLEQAEELGIALAGRLKGEGA